MPGGLALLHPRHHDPYLASQSFLVLGRSGRPLPFGAPDGKPTDIFLLLCCLDDRLHLRVLARLCALHHTTDFLARLRAAAGAEEMRAACIEAERQVLLRPAAGSRPRR
jgi:mannitol/fructose-specific phosphotransferase system IIA component (Ntr-type)